MGNNISLPVANHSNILIGDKVFIWGGSEPDLPLVHDSPRKRQFTSSITVYNILQSSLHTRKTTGTPPNGIIDYSSCCIGEDIYYFGGCCKNNPRIGCCHNNMLVLNTGSLEWREIDCEDGPIKKAICGMIHLHINGEDYLLVIGGCGPRPLTKHGTTTHKYNGSYGLSNCCTNEVYIMCMSIPGKWTEPIMTGCEFPPLAGFSINTLPGNRAIVFAGSSIVNSRIVRTNDVFILTYSPINNSLNVQKLKLLDPHMQWPVARTRHSSVIITSVSGENGERKHHLLVMGGVDLNNDAIPDTWILSIDSMKWKEVIFPKVVCGRYNHSMTCFKMSKNCVWLLITGGLDYDDEFVGSIIVELVFSPSDDIWGVSKILNEEDMKNKAQYELVANCLAKREKEYQQMMESTVPAAAESGLLTDVQKLEEQIELLKEQLKQKDEETIIMLHKKDEIIMEREDIIQQSEESIKEKKDKIYQKNIEIHQNKETIQIKQDEIQSLLNVICEKDELLQQNQCEILDLRSQLEIHPWVIQDREEVNVTDTIIGGGSYGEVRVAVFRGTRVAAKLLHELIVSRHNIDIFTREMEISSGIHHPNIVQFIGATRINNPILLYELMPTSLHKRLQDDESLTHAQIVSIGSDICTAMCYLHQWRPQPIIHRDISSPNVLMEPLPNDKWRAKLSDFGSANLQMHIKTVVPGNPAYAAPEARYPDDHSPAMDIYSFGVLLTEVSLHCAPEMSCTRREQSAHSIEWVEMRVIVLKCINNDRSQRLSSVQLLTELQKL